MAISLGAVFGLRLTKGKAEAAVLTGLPAVAGPVIARTATQFVVGWIPGVGNAVNAATAAAITEAIGWIIAGQFYEDSLDDEAGKASRSKRCKIRGQTS
jgi:uncharacterized protein (DUF697 family)